MPPAEPTPPDFGTLFAAAPQAYLVLDPDLTIVAASDLYLAATDRTRPDIVGRHIFEAFPENPDRPGTVEQGPLEVSLRHVLKMRRTHQMGVIQYDIPRPEAEGGGFTQRFWTPAHQPVLGPDGEIRYIIQTPNDVTDSVVKQREADARLRLAMRAADLGSWEYEPETDIFRRSPAVDEMFGFAPGEGGARGGPIFERIHPDDIPAVQAAIAGLVASPDTTVVRLDYRIRHPDGGERSVISRGEVMRTPQGAVRVLGVLMDVSADRSREAALAAALGDKEALLRQKESLLGEVNHRVKNSLQLVASALSLQSRTLGDPAAVAAFEKAIARVRAITSVHERLYRNDNPHAVEMAGYLRDLSQDLANGTELREGLVVEVDAIELRTERAIPVALIVNELMTNALAHAYPPGRPGPISLRLRRIEDGMLELSVADRGAPRTDGPGTGGLGTRLVSAMARQLGGRFRGEREASGYRAAVTFPAEAA